MRFYQMQHQELQELQEEQYLHVIVACWLAFVSQSLQESTKPSTGVTEPSAGLGCKGHTIISTHSRTCPCQLQTFLIDKDLHG